MSIVSKNPATEEIIKEYDKISSDELKSKLDKAHEAYLDWKNTSMEERKQLFAKMAIHLKENSKELSKKITEEMGKTWKKGQKEIEKCAWNAEYFVENVEDMLKDEHVETQRKENFVRFDPLGIILFVMPWNFPYWQVLRQAVPTILAGNTVVLKHASNVAGCALDIEEIFRKVGFPEGVFQTLLIDSSQVEEVLSDFRVKGVSLTGSEGAGSAVASLAGKYIKRSVMELGGNDALIVLKDADVTKAATTCSDARLNNAGQVCNSPKRVIIVKDRYQEFVDLLKEKYEATQVGDPMDKDTDMGPLSSKQILDEVKDQVSKSVELGAELITGGEEKEGRGYYYKPTILTLNPEGTTLDEVRESEMPAYYQEIFGPVSSVIIVEDEDEAIEVANDTKYGLTASIWSEDEEHAKSLISKINAGSIAINGTIHSDPRLPFGGINNAGYGRELSRYGLLEFVNLKTVAVFE